jgi:hypothetical protein
MRTPTPETDDLRDQFLFSEYGARLFQQLPSGVVGATRTSNEGLLSPTWSDLYWREGRWSRHSSTNSINNGGVETGSTGLIVAQDDRMAYISYCGGV